MRTTININEQILAIAKQKAADRKTTLGAIIEDWSFRLEKRRFPK